MRFRVYYSTSTLLYFYLHASILNSVNQPVARIMSYRIVKSTLALTIIIITFASSCDAQITGRTDFYNYYDVLSINPR